METSGRKSGVNSRVSGSNLKSVVHLRVKAQRHVASFPKFPVMASPGQRVSGWFAGAYYGSERDNNLAA